MALPLTAFQGVDPRLYTVSLANPSGLNVLNSCWMVHAAGSRKYYVVATFLEEGRHPMAMIFHTPVEGEPESQDDEIAYFTTEKVREISQKVVGIVKAWAMRTPHEPVTIMTFREQEWTALTSRQEIEPELATTHALVIQVLDLATLPAAGEA